MTVKESILECVYGTDILFLQNDDGKWGYSVAEFYERGDEYLWEYPFNTFIDALNDAREFMLTLYLVYSNFNTQKESKETEE